MSKLTLEGYLGHLATWEMFSGLSSNPSRQRNEKDQKLRISRFLDSVFL